MSRSWLPLLSLLIATSAGASGAARTHDGFFLRLQGGVGGTSASQDELTLKGGSGALNVEIGGALTENFILYGKLFGTGTPDPDLEVGDITFEGNNSDLSLNFGALGAGVSYYFMPVNLYVSGAVSLTSLGLTEDGDEVGDTGQGLGLHLGVGKEWWVSDQWGLGLGAELALSRVNGAENTDDWGVGSVVLLFSATFN
jgi:hypothetical protein